MLDYNFTLAPFHIDPKNAFPYLNVREVLNALMQNPKNYIVIVTGRWTKDLHSLLKSNSSPDIWDTHGLERLKPDGSYKIEPMDDFALKGLVEAEEWAEAVYTKHNVRYEQKPGSLAIHWWELVNEKIELIKMEMKPQFQRFADMY